MKTRNGFVSNSSSSSFVVAFPKEPKSFDDVYEMVFDSKEGGIQPYDFVDGMSHTQIAERVWKDLQNGKEDEWDHKRVPAKKEDIIDEFSNLYNYWSANSCVSCWGVKRDELGGQWSDQKDDYWGIDEKTLIELRDFIIDTESREEEMRNRQRDIIRTQFKERSAPYAYEGGKDRDGRPYTKEDVEAYEAYRDALRKFENEHEEYSKIKEALWSSNKYEKRKRLEKKLAKTDTEAFLSDNKDAFVAIFSYADDGGEGTLEHGDIFKNLPNVKISHH